MQSPTIPGIRVARLAALIALMVALLTISDGRTDSVGDLQPACVRLHGYTLTYYRTSKLRWPPQNRIDPYDLFQKDARGDLIVRPTGHNSHSKVAGADLNEFQLKTNKGTPVLVYQVVPLRRSQYKADCHGLTFLSGEYWLDNDQVTTLLRDGDWEVVSEAEAQPGDVVIYRDGRGEIMHSARVRKRNAKDQVIVDSKYSYLLEVKGLWAERVVP